MVLEASLEDLVLCVLGDSSLTLVDVVRLNHLLEGAQLQHALSLIDWKRAEGVERRVFSVSQSQ